jgi:DNA-binding NarL/FixJ family response regulator
MKEKKIRVAVIEDDKPFRVYLEMEIRRMLSCNFEYGIASLEMLRQENYIDDYNPDVLLLDMRLADDYGGGMQVLDFLRKKKKKMPKVLIVSGHCDSWMIGLMQQKENVCGCIRKSALATSEYTFLEGIIKKAYQTDEFISILDAQPLTTHSPHLLKPKIRELTDIQQAILTRLCKGLNQKEIAEVMQKPQNTVGNHVAGLKKKFKVETTAQLTMKATELGYLD